MIRKYREIDEPKLVPLLRENRLKNIYMYIDAKTYGFDSNETDTWLIVEFDEVKGLLYRYYNSLQIMSFNPLDEGTTEEIAKHIISEKYVMIQGEYKLLQSINQCLNFTYSITEGCLIDMSGCTLKKETISINCPLEQLEKAARLVCADREIGGHYTVPELTKQFEERVRQFGCRNRIIFQDNKIIGHAATYAEHDSLAVIGGVVVDPAYRGKGYGKKLVQELAVNLSDENKESYLYCFDKALTDWYLSFGGINVLDYAKLTLTAN